MEICSEDEMMNNLNPKKQDTCWPLGQELRGEMAELSIACSNIAKQIIQTKTNVVKKNSGTSREIRCEIRG
jgi:hypothetical protein